VVVNFLHVDDENYFITICFSKIVVTINVSKKLVRMGRKFLFVCVLCKTDRHRAVDE
jgi:hypothetical protein